jgi:transposase-like protein DUF772
MRPQRWQRWQPPVALSAEETAIIRRIHRAKLFVFLREQRHQLFTPDFQDELARELYADKPKGHPPIAPAQLALATVRQADTGVCDDEVIEATTRDRRWQLALDCLDCSAPPLSKATLVAFRQRLIAHEGDRRLVERTLEGAQASGWFSPKAFRVALASSPLWGAGKVEDTYNLLGQALRKAVSVLARQQGRGLAAMAAMAALAAAVGPQMRALVGGPLSLKFEGGARPGLGRPASAHAGLGRCAGRARRAGAVAEPPPDDRGCGGGRQRAGQSRRRDPDPCARRRVAPRRASHAAAGGQPRAAYQH